jgi:hypothetical protein
MHIHVFIRLFGFGGSASKFCWLLIPWSMLSRFMVLAENVIEAEIFGLPMVV